MEDEIQVPINSDQDIIVARQKGRSLATALGFSSGDATLIAATISELARNIVAYAASGNIRVKVINGSTRQGIQVIAHDDGPGIADVQRAMHDGFSTSGGLGLGLKRLVDEFEIVSEENQGTTVTAKKWKP